MKYSQATLPDKELYMGREALTPFAAYLTSYILAIHIRPPFPVDVNALCLKGSHQTSMIQNKVAAPVIENNNRIKRNFNSVRVCTYIQIVPEDRLCVNSRTK